MLTQQCAAAHHFGPTAETTPLPQQPQQHREPQQLGPQEQQGPTAAAFSAQHAAAVPFSGDWPRGAAAGGARNWSGTGNWGGGDGFVAPCLDGVRYVLPHRPWAPQLWFGAVNLDAGWEPPRNFFHPRLDGGPRRAGTTITFAALAVVATHIPLWWLQVGFLRYSATTTGCSIHSGCRTLPKVRSAITAESHRGGCRRRFRRCAVQPPWIISSWWLQDASGGAVQPPRIISSWWLQGPSGGAQCNRPGI